MKYDFYRETMPLSPLAEEQTTRMEERLKNYFARPDAPHIFLPYAVSRQLHVPAEPMYVALEELDFLPRGASLSGLMNALGRGKKGSALASKYMLNRDQILDLNRHSLARTQSNHQLTDVLHFPTSQITETAQRLEIRPLLQTRMPVENAPEEYQGYFNLDQVVRLREGLRHPTYEAPDKLLPAERVRRALKISEVLLSRLFKQLEITPRMIENPRTGIKEEYYSEDEVVQVIFARDRYRQEAYVED
jgi:hypothetical protein